MQESKGLERFWFFRQSQRVQMVVAFSGLAIVTLCSCVGIGIIAAVTDDDEDGAAAEVATVTRTAMTESEATPTAEPTNTPEATATPEPTNTPEPTATDEPTPTEEPTATPSPTPAPTSTPTPAPTAPPEPTATPTIAPTPTMSTEEEMAQYRRDLDVREVVKNVDAYYNWKLYYEGEVLSIIADSSGTIVQIKAKYPGAGPFDWEGILIVYDDPLITQGIFEGDVVGVYARPITSYTFTNSLGGEVTQPLFDGDYLQKLN